MKMIGSINESFVQKIYKKVEQEEDITREEFKDVNTIASEELKRITVL